MTRYIPSGHTGHCKDGDGHSWRLVRRMGVLVLKCHRCPALKEIVQPTGRYMMTPEEEEETL